MRRHLRATPNYHSPFFFLDPALLDGSTVAIEGPDARHLAQVRRAGIGDGIIVSDGAGRVIQAHVTSSSPMRIEAAVDSERRVEPHSPALTVFQAGVASTKLDWLVQKLVEMGAAEIGIFGASRSGGRWEYAEAARKSSRWEAVALAAAKQARRAWLPRVAGLVPFKQVVSEAEGFDLFLVADATATASLRSVLEACDPAPAKVGLVIGPEGGLTESEVSALVSAGGKVVTLGDEILRTETAGLVIGAIVLYAFGGLGGPVRH